MKRYYCSVREGKRTSNISQTFLPESHIFLWFFEIRDLTTLSNFRMQKKRIAEGPRADWILPQIRRLFLRYSTRTEHIPKCVLCFWRETSCKLWKIAMILKIILLSFRSAMNNEILHKPMKILWYCDLTIRSSSFIQYFVLIPSDELWTHPLVDHEFSNWRC